jgi:Zinc-binding loop region of homing endonuclease
MASGIRGRRNGVANLETENRFWSKVKIINDLTSCWEWQGFLFPTGHGQFWMDGRDIKAQRAAWLIIHGPLVSTDYICHRCDNARCVRPTHIYKGTHQTNQADRRKNCSFRHEKASYTKLTWELADKIRALNIPFVGYRPTFRGQYPRGKYSQLEVAKMFGISPTTVRRIWNQEDIGGWRREVPINGQSSIIDQP